MTQIKPYAKCNSKFFQKYSWCSQSTLVRQTQAIIFSALLSVISLENFFDSTIRYDILKMFWANEVGLLENRYILLTIQLFVDANVQWSFKTKNISASS